jgi:hypothetical protein
VGGLSHVKSAPIARQTSVGHPRKWQNLVLVLLLWLEQGLEQASDWR